MNQLELSVITHIVKPLMRDLLSLQKEFDTIKNLKYYLEEVTEEPLVSNIEFREVCEEVLGKSKELENKLSILNGWIETLGEDK